MIILSGNTTDKPGCVLVPFETVNCVRSIAYSVAVAVCAVVVGPEVADCPVIPASSHHAIIDLNLAVVNSECVTIKQVSHRAILKNNGEPIVCQVIPIEGVI